MMHGETTSNQWWSFSKLAWRQQRLNVIFVLLLMSHTQTHTHTHTHTYIHIFNVQSEYSDRLGRYDYLCLIAIYKYIIAACLVKIFIEIVEFWDAILKFWNQEVHSGSSTMPHNYPDATLTFTLSINKLFPFPVGVFPVYTPACLWNPNSKCNTLICKNINSLLS